MEGNGQIAATESVALVKVSPEYDGLVMHCSPAEARRRMQELQAFVREVMEENVDFGVIPGTKEKSLWQSGAQKLCELYGLAPDFSIEEKVEDWDKGFFYYRIKCVLTDRRSGTRVGVGYGSCNSKEKKYAGRWVAEADVPTWLDKTKLRRREGTEWLWRSKLPAGIDVSKLPTQKREGRNGPYEVYGVQTIQMFVPNEDAADLVNTILKMACKRSHVHATLAVTRSGGLFTQDLEDLPPEVIGRAAERRPWEKDGEVIDAEVRPMPSPPAPANGGAKPGPAEASLAEQEAFFARQIDRCNTDEALQAVRKDMKATFGDKVPKTLADRWRDREKKLKEKTAAPPKPEAAEPAHDPVTGEVEPEPGSDG